ncbi:MAG: hypothetical protein PHT60_04815 [Acidiphilium sp.]|nr:hypothetical protein [Acidiphilium sp.]
MRRAGEAVIDQIIAWAARGQSAPARVLEGAASFAEWAHYPQPDAIDPHSFWRFYYHAHPRSQRLRDEHGHFHIFVPAPATARPDTAAAFSHLIAVSVDAKGLPLRLFTTNRWVTDEVWQPADAMIRHLRSPALHDAEPRDVAGWLNHLLVAFKPAIAALLTARDERLTMAALHRRAPLEDRRLRIPSQRMIRIEHGQG